MEEIPTASSGKRRIRILALHGTQGNNEITKMQLENINIREEDYDIVYIRGTIQERHGHPDLETMVDGPFYSWIDETSRVSKERSIREAVVNVHSVLSSGLGPFDGIYGFSTGALIAAIVANTIYDPFFKTDFIATGSRSSVSANMIDVSLHGSSVEPAAYNSLSSLASKNNMRDEETPPSSTSSNESLQFIILACAAAPFSNMDEFRRITRCKDSFYPGSNCDVPSFHIIATEDVNKTKSEDWAMVFSDPHLMYISSVHGIGRAQRNDHELLDSLSCFIAHKGHPRPEKIVPKYRLVSKASSISVMPHKQVALVRLDSSELPDGGLMGRGVGTTIDSLLKARPREKPFLYNARGNGVFTSYGQLSDFIRGDGNLSNLGVQCNEVVAYGCPAGATALAAVAFLSIASSAIAAPLAPNTSEADTLDILEQFDAKYLIMFEGVECPGVYAAFQKYSLRGNAKIVRAFVQYTTPGMFAYTKRSPSHGAHKKLVSTVRRISSNLHRSYNDSSEQSLGNETCVLLRTSGTTSRPKVVQLTQNALIRNGGIIASSLSLEENDVCYSVMPLFHIGGLSASIISTLVSGGTVCCETMQFNPERMIDALATSNPKPTWYSSVPTIHNATVDFIKTIGENIPDSNANSWENSKNANKYSSYGISSDGIWVPADRNSGKGHNLRFIRSGAAELSSADALALSQTYGGIPFIPTYSMSEQMPITQPPTGKYDMTDDRPGSVGVPIAASIAIVNGSLRPLWHGKVGEIAISGSTVMTQYLENPDADRKAFFYLPLDIVGSSEETLGRYFLTGDTGKMDRAGFITLNGRTKELIKKGGEQISPFEVEDVLKKHHWVQNAICFSVPSKLYGEAVGAALVLSNASPSDIELDEIISEMRTLMKKCKFDPLKWPMRWKIVMDEDLPRTESKKYIRIGLSEVLGLDEGSAMISMTSLIESLEKKASIDYDVLSGLRFVLACYVMFMHIGSNDSWGAFSNLRLCPWHVHTFFLLAGYIMASPMSTKIHHKFKYVLARIGSMYSLYFLAVLFGLGNLLVSCRPSTFRKDFSWHSRPDDLFMLNETGQRSQLFCEGTPLFPSSYWGSLFFTLVSYFSGLTIAPFWVLNWWLGYFLWFIAMYNQCLMIYPITYNLLHTRKKQGRFLIKVVVALVGASIAIVMTMWFGTRDPERFSKDEESDITGSDGWLHSAIVLGFYLFSPFWMIYVVIGITLAFVYDAYRPKETHHAKRYGYIADICTMMILTLSIIQVSQGGVDETRNWFFRPSEADNSYLDNASTNRLWDTIYGRLFCPITTIWIYALSTGEGMTARLLRNEILVSVLAPNSYGCFLFHQMVGQWYFAATRNGLWWNWWSYRKTMYWFSPQPIPVDWFEYPYIVGLVILFTRVVTKHVEPHVSRFFIGIGTGIHDSRFEGNGDIRSSSDLMLAVVRILTGVEATMNNTSEECGLGSIGMPIVVFTLNKMLAKDHEDAAVNVSEMIQARTIADMVAVIDTAKSRASDSGI